jgi:pyridoxamine 5'-phosphate oxidase
MRRPHRNRGLSEKSAPREPLAFFERWLREAVAKVPLEPNAMTLATSSQAGAPRARTVLLKDFSGEGFVFFTNYASRKAQELSANPRACLMFYWPRLSRQVIIEGRVSKVSRRRSQEYFRLRPRASQAAASISAQSRPVASRRALEAAMKRFEEKYKGKDIPCPPFWGGYVLKPVRMEFWQGRPNRLHDRLLYSKLKSGRWKLSRLAP